MQDTYRQAAIDLVLGSGISDEMLAQVDQDRPLAAAEPDPAAALDHVRYCTTFFYILAAHFSMGEKMFYEN